MRFSLILSSIMFLISACGDSVSSSEMAAAPEASAKGGVVRYAKSLPKEAKALLASDKCAVKSVDAAAKYIVKITEENDEVVPKFLTVSDVQKADLNQTYHVTVDETLYIVTAKPQADSCKITGVSTEQIGTEPIE